MQCSSVAVSVSTDVTHLRSHDSPDLSCCEDRGLAHQLGADLTLDDGLAMPSMTPAARQRSGYADVSHLLKQKLQRSNTAFTPYEYSPSTHTFTPKSSSPSGGGVDDPLAIPVAQRQKSSFDMVKNKLQRYISGAATDSTDCVNCASNKPCAIHKDKQKQKALLAMRDLKAHRQLPNTPTKAEPAVRMREKRV